MKGCIVERQIEGEWFAAVIEEIDEKKENLRLYYLDDGNVEDCVPLVEVRLTHKLESEEKLALSNQSDCKNYSTISSSSSSSSSSDGSIASSRSSSKGIVDEGSGGRGSSTNTSSSSSSSSKFAAADVKPSRKDTLPKPLAGLVEDDSEARSTNRPTIVIHDCAETEQAIIINGAENKLAAGGGLRALRYLKH